MMDSFYQKLPILGKLLPFFKKYYILNIQDQCSLTRMFEIMFVSSKYAILHFGLYLSIFAHFKKNKSGYHFLYPKSIIM